MYLLQLLSEELLEVLRVLPELESIIESVDSARNPSVLVRSLAFSSQSAAKNGQ